MKFIRLVNHDPEDRKGMLKLKPKSKSKPVEEPVVVHAEERCANL